MQDLIASSFGSDVQYADLQSLKVSSARIMSGSDPRDMNAIVQVANFVKVQDDSDAIIVGEVRKLYVFILERIPGYRVFAEVKLFKTDESSDACIMPFHLRVLKSEKDAEGKHVHCIVELDGTRPVVDVQRVMLNLSGSCGMYKLLNWYNRCDHDSLPVGSHLLGEGTVLDLNSNAV